MKKSKIIGLVLGICLCISLLCMGVYSIANFSLNLQGELEYEVYATTVVAKAYKSNTQTALTEESLKTEAVALEEKTHATLTGVTEYGSNYQSTYKLLPFQNQDQNLEQWALTFDVTSDTKTYLNYYVVEITNCASQTAYAYFTDNTSSDVAQNFYTYVSGRTSIEVGETTTMVIGYALKDPNADISSLSLNINLAVTYMPGFESKFVNDYLYRVGNQNEIMLSSIFRCADLKDDSSVDVEISKINSNTNVQATYTKNTTNWREGTIKFTGTGPAKISANGATQIVEVVDAVNATAVSNIVGNKNIVLLNNVKLSSGAKFTLQEGTTFYGNGFTFDITEGTIAPKQHGIIELNGATIDNTKIIGSVYTTCTEASTGEYFSAAVYVSGRSTISNCYIANCRSNIRVHTGVTCDIINTVLDGGCYANLDIQGGTTANLTNVTTINMPRNDVVGLGIVIGADSVADAKLNISGTFTQYNWIAESDEVYIKSANAKKLFDEMFKDTYAKLQYTHNGVKYINTGILCMSSKVATGNITGIPTIYTQMTTSLSGYSGWVASFDMTNSINQQMFTGGVPTWSNDYEPKDQGLYKPDFVWNYPAEYNAAEQKIKIVIDEGEQYVFDPNILSPLKHGNVLPLTIKMNDVNYTGKTLTFAENGDYTFVYTITDEYNYNANGKANHTEIYTINLDVNVSVIKAGVSAPEFTFIDKNSKTYTSRIITASDGFKYAMPDVTAVEDGVVGSLTIGDDTFYYPIIKGYNKSSMSDFDRYYPLYNGVSIKNYTNASGSYDTINSTLQTAYTGYNWVKECGIEAHGDKGWDCYDYYADYGGYARKTNALASSNIYNQEELVVYWVLYSLLAGTNETYYFYIGYEFEKGSTSCVTGETLITLADGSQKRVDQLTGKEQLLVWNHETGKLDTAPIAYIVDHDQKEFENQVITLTFSEGYTIDIIGEHVFYDVTLGKYIPLDFNAIDYVDHEFVALIGDEVKTVRLEKVETIVRKTTVYEVVTYKHLTCFTNGILSTSAYLDPLLNNFDIDSQTLAYSQQAMQEDIETYGLYTYDDFEGLISEQAFELYNAKYLKIAIGKGYITWEDVLEMIDIFYNVQVKPL